MAVCIWALLSRLSYLSSLIWALSSALSGLFYLSSLIWALLSALSGLFSLHTLVCQLFLRASSARFFMRAFVFSSFCVLFAHFCLAPFCLAPSATRLFRILNNLFKSLELFRFYHINSKLSLGFRNCVCHLDFRPPHADVLPPMSKYAGAIYVIIISRTSCFTVNAGGAPNTYTNVSSSKNCFFCVRVDCLRLSCNAP